MRGPFTLQVEEVFDLQDAFSERERLQALTGIEGWVVPAREGSADPHRIVLGAYRSLARATNAANMLKRSRTLASVAVISLPSRSARQ
jgi:hypothetical protein